MIPNDYNLYSCNPEAFPSIPWFSPRVLARCSQPSLGTVHNVEEAVAWLSYTYLYIRMLRNPVLYGVPEEALENDKVR
jgi:replicative superfamily II helicase